MQDHNWLADETSPYLLQHAHNPIAWHPWGEQAFVEAAQRDAPIFLSIGYASCHWCHVMAEESFEDHLIADQLNAHYVSIKVDREQWPDVDAFYMQACVALQGQGGWPLTVFLLPDRRPFYATTYLPAGTANGEMGLSGLLTRITNLWEADRGRVEQWADQLTAALRAKGAQQDGTPNVSTQTARLEAELLLAEDKKNGGIGKNPKFPNAPSMRFLLCRAAQRTQVDAGLRMAMRALRSMADGGIHDHVGHGFFRYTVDAAWRTPHYEKMLQDNALLALTYLEAARYDPPMAEVARDALAYITGTLTCEQGGFFSSQDADDPLGEGAYYQWTPEEVHAVLGMQDGARCCTLLGIGVDGGEQAHEQKKGAPRCDPKTGCTIDNSSKPEGWLPYRTAICTEPDRAFLQTCLLKMANARDQRPAPRIIALCPILGNGIAIAALATASGQVNAPDHLQAAERCARFIERSMVVDGRLMGSWSGGVASCAATVEGYAAWIWGLLCLHAVAPEDGWLARAEHWQTAQRTLFLRADGGLTLTGSDMHDLPGTQCAVDDDAMPSGAAMTANNLKILHRLTGNSQYKDDADRLLTASLIDAEGQLFSSAALLTAAIC